VKVREQFHYICCSECGVKWQVAERIDTRHGYTCPDCDRKRMRREAIRGNLDYFVRAYGMTWHGVSRSKRREVS